jgi:tetratricopeptide (TPR) repeat protein
MSNKIDRIRFLSVPESLRGSVEGTDDFSIDPSIPIPAEIPDGEEILNVKELSFEMITAGMLRVIQSGQYPERNGYYRSFVLALRPGILGELTEAAIFKARNGEFDLALEIFDALSGLFPLSPSTRLNRALVLEEQAMSLLKNENEGAAACFQSAGEAYEETMSLNPPFPDAFFNAGFFYLGQKKFSPALDCFAKYIEIANDDDKIKQAKKIVKEIEASCLDDETFGAACELITQGQEEEGLPHIKNFIERHPGVWNGWFMLGWALRRLKRWGDGAAAFRKAIDLGGGGSDTRNELAICLMETGDATGARREPEAALRQANANIKITSHLGLLAMKTGNEGEAAAFFRTVLELDPSDPVANKYFEGQA